VVLGDAAEELVEAADAGFPDAEVAEGRQNRGAQAGLVPVDGLRHEAFLAWADMPNNPVLIAARRAAGA
jgi:hypothetical protein